MEVIKGQLHRRSDGVRINYDPYAPDMIEKYGKPGSTDNEGFNPYTDSVGPGIYGGIVKRDHEGQIEIGEQYQGHNPMPGPVYAGGGYTSINSALQDLTTLNTLLDKYPDLINDISTGGATPLHMCGMSRTGQLATSILIEKGGHLEALDTYGYAPLHRMASNNLHIGAQALLEAGANPHFRTGRGETAMSIARSAGAGDVLKVLTTFLQKIK